VNTLVVPDFLDYMNLVSTLSSTTDSSILNVSKQIILLGFTIPAKFNPLVLEIHFEHDFS